MIAITGATGTVGGELVRRLSDRGESVRAISRRPPGGEIAGGVEWVRADLSERESLRSAFEGARTLFLLTGNAEDMVRLQKNAIAAADRAGVERVVKLSALGATDHSKSVIGLWHYSVERVLRASGLDWTILRPHHFTQNLLDPNVFDRATGRVYSASGDGVIPFVDTRDIAAVVAAVLTEDGHGGEVYSITGPEAISYRAATEILADVLGRELTYVSESVDDAWARLRATGLPAWLVGARLALAEYQRAGGPTERTTDVVERLTGRPARTVRDFARDYADELRV